jgi:RHS repeat-associated protein
MFAHRLPLLFAALLTAARLFGAYTYSIVDPLTSITSPDPNRWFANGSPTAGTGGLSGDGSLIYKQTPPGGFSNYEVRAKLNLPSGGGSYVLYLRASDDARLTTSGGSGTFLAFEVVVEPNLVNGGCVASVKGWRRAANALSPMTTNPIPCYSGMEVRAVAMAGSQVVCFVDGVYYGYWADYVVMSGRPGIGGFGMGAGNSISRVDLGPIDSIAPSAVPISSVATAVFANRVEFQWPGVADDANGIGIWGYNLFRNGSYIGVRQSPEMVDESAQPGTSYLYQVQTVDFHGNSSGLTDIPVTTPATGNIDPRRTGVRPLGTYWGGLGEQIDLQSGNVNFSMPLFKAQARGGWGVTFALSYNSQNWRRDTAGTPRTWNHGRDIGYGYGWKFLAGSMSPVFNGYYNVGHYRFTDSTGAEYRFYETSFGSGEWLAKDGLFLTYRSAEKKLYFPDGSWWYFGAVASGTEMDTGTAYPTLFQDRNGNQIRVRYKPGRGLAAINGSGRIAEVEDVRQQAPGGATFYCTYVNDALQHLNTCVTAGNLKTGENYQVGIGPASPLTDPFLGQSFGDKQVLGGITNISDGINAPFYFGYDNGASSGPGELTAAVFPYGGSLNWGYSTGTLAGGRQFRKVATRAYNANDGQGSKTAYLHFYPGSNAQLPVHDWTVLQDPTLTADKAWWWNTTLGGPLMGLNRNQSDRKMPVSVDVAQREIVWDLTANGNPYVSRVTETMDPGHPDAKIKRTEQAINDFGNLLWRKEYAHGSTTAVAREFSYSYITSSTYLAKHIRNLVSTVVLSRPGSSVTVLENTYDQYTNQSGCVVGSLAEMQGATLHDAANYGPLQSLRGNVTRSTSLGKTRCMGYTTGGSVRLATDLHGHAVSMTLDPAKNYAVPSAMTSMGLSSSVTFDGAFNMTQNSGPNGATATFGWDGMKRQTSQTLPSGQVINHEYGLGQGPGASWHKVTTGISPNFRWTKTVFDGFGRTLEVISGHKVGSTETAVSKVVTRYTPCACSSIGKVEWVTMPIGPTVNPLTAAKTVYEYDAIGRTVKVTPPGNAGFTSYQYGGTTAKTIDPKGRWKKFENDALGNLITVWEPHPVGPGADYVTSYTYTLLGKLNVVTMTRPGKGVGAPPTVTQTRTYAYNSYGELQSVTHPENGTTLYEYFADGSLKKKTDAKGQRLEWSYDAEGRPVTVKRFSSLGVEDVCARVTTTYGSQGLDGSFSGANLAGRLASVTTGCANVPAGETETRGGRVDELYSYNSAGAVVTKRVRILRGNSVVTKDIGYTFDGEGKLASIQYPDEAKPYVMSYDAMARPSGMTQEYQLPGDPAWLNRNWVSGVSYGVAGQLLGMSWYGGGSSTFGETRTYNERLQLTRQQATGMDLEYVFTDGQNPMNDGRIIARINRLNTANPETVKYKYDELNRLIEAEQTAGPGAQSSWWGMTWDFDGFGNRWSQDQKAGRVGIPSSVTFDLGTNRVSTAGYGHDANGNMTAMPGVSGALIYDVDNRLTKVDKNGSHEQYRYLGDNKRYWKRTNQGGNVAEEYYLYGVGGQRIASYPASYNEQTSVLTVDAANKKLDVYFGGRVIWQNGRAIVQDRLGSVMARGNGSGGVESHDYYPYGEERVATVGDRNKFGTYHRDQTGLDYADQRFYNSAIGRFLTSDPYEASGGAAEPGSWGRGGYVGGDPINYNDPQGLKCVAVTVGGNPGWVDVDDGTGCDKAGVAANGSMTSHTINVEGFFTGFGGQMNANSASLQAQPFEWWMAGGGSGGFDWEIERCKAAVDHQAAVQREAFAQWLEHEFTPMNSATGTAVKTGAALAVEGWISGFAGLSRGLSGALAGGWVGAVVGFSGAVLSGPVVDERLKAFLNAVGEAVIDQSANQSKQHCHGVNMAIPPIVP